MTTFNILPSLLVFYVHFQNRVKFPPKANDKYTGKGCAGDQGYQDYQGGKYNV